MKWAILAMVMIAIALGAGFTGCSNEIGSQRQFPSEPDLDTGISDGSENPPENLVPLHSETLQLVHKYDDEVDLEDAAFRAAREMAARYGAPPFTRKEVQDLLAEGARLATMSAEDIMAQVLDPQSEEYKWYMAFVEEATPETVEADLEVFIKKRPMPRCQVTYGPTGSSPSTMASTQLVVSEKLQFAVDMTVDSANYWYKTRKHREFVTLDPRSGEYGGGGVHLGDGWPGSSPFLVETLGDLPWFMLLSPGSIPRT